MKTILQDRRLPVEKQIEFVVGGSPTIFLHRPTGSKAEKAMTNRLGR